MMIDSIYSGFNYTTIVCNCDLATKNWRFNQQTLLFEDLFEPIAIVFE